MNRDYGVKGDGCTGGKENLSGPYERLDCGGGDLRITSRYADIVVLSAKGRIKYQLVIANKEGTERDPTRAFIKPLSGFHFDESTTDFPL